MCGSLFFGRIITILFSGVCTLFLTISAIVPSRGSTFFVSGCLLYCSQAAAFIVSECYIAHERLPFLVWMTIVEWVECMGVASGCG